ncbi:MAG: cobalamin B12-binding domain-containing protein [Bacteroidota bacterium]
MKETLTKTKHKKFLEALIAGDRPACSAYAHEYLRNNHSVQELYEDVFKTSLYDVGKLWEYNQISVATEHLASAIVEAILNEFYQEIVSNEKIGKRIILSCVEQEYHQIGIKMISDLFEMHGWYSYFLGANTPIKDLISYTKLLRPDLIGISMSLYFHMPALEEALQSIGKELPGTPVLVGGQAFQHGGIEVLEQFIGVYYKPDLKSTESFINELTENG